MADDHPHHLDAALKHVAEAARKAQPFADRMMQKQMSAALPAMASAPKAKAEPQAIGSLNGFQIDSSSKLFAPKQR